MDVSNAQFSHLLVGGGLHNALIALALRAAQPDARVLLVEAQPRVAGNHTWSLHALDTPERMAPIVDPLVEFEWPSYVVRFPGYERVLPSTYRGFTSEPLAEAVERAFDGWHGSELRTNTPVEDVEPGRVTLASGEAIEAATVFDGRGPSALDVDPERTGYQKFYGIDVSLDAPHGLAQPLLMDATVPQVDGYRFFYVLPHGPQRLLIEDTRFSRSPDLDVEAMRDTVLAELKRRGWNALQEHRAEHGVLPMPWHGKIHRPTPKLVRTGYAGGWLHPATGYSIPLALRLAEAVAFGPMQAAHDRLSVLHRAASKQLGFYHMLNQLLFECFEPEDMWNSLHRFYKKGTEAQIARFYAARSTPTDRTRMLIGRPPRKVKLVKAMSVLR